MVCNCSHVCCVYWSLVFNSGENPSYSDYNQHENANFVERGSVIIDLKAAQEAFNNKNYEEAILLL